MKVAHDDSKPKAQENDIRRACGCLRTSDKLRQILKTFPNPPPPTPNSLAPSAPPQQVQYQLQPTQHQCLSGYCAHALCSPAHLAYPTPLYGITQAPASVTQQDQLVTEHPIKRHKRDDREQRTMRKESCARTWGVISNLVQLVQIAVTATALAIYYLIYCYMQLVYYTLKSALYFHKAEWPMKITIAVVTITSLVMACNILIRMERLMGINP